MAFIYIGIQYASNYEFRYRISIQSQSSKLIVWNWRECHFDGWSKWVLYHFDQKVAEQYILLVLHGLTDVNMCYKIYFDPIYDNEVLY